MAIAKDDGDEGGSDGWYDNNFGNNVKDQLVPKGGFFSIFRTEIPVLIGFFRFSLKKSLCGCFPIGGRRRKGKGQRGILVEVVIVVVVWTTTIQTRGFLSKHKGFFCVWSVSILFT